MNLIQMSEEWTEDYRTLRTLKSVDEKIHWVSRDVEKIPQQLQELQAQLAANKLGLEASEGRLKDQATALREAERTLKEKEDALHKAQGKLMEVKTNEAYQAALKENESQRQAKGTYEDRVLEALSVVDTLKETAEQARREFELEQSRGQIQMAELEATLTSLRQELEQLLGQRQEWVQKLSPPTAALYKKALAALRHGAIAVADNGRCTGCSVLIRPQIYNEILGAKMIHRCGHCGRVLIGLPTDNDK